MHLPSLQVDNRFVVSDLLFFKVHSKSVRYAVVPSLSIISSFDIVLPDNIALGNKSPWELAAQKHNIWTTLALNANDQLRLKMAWSLSQVRTIVLSPVIIVLVTHLTTASIMLLPQIIVVGRPSTEATSQTFVDTEGELAFYDSFVRTGFGK